MWSSELVELIKKIALEVVESAKPTKCVIGTVTAISPITVQIDQTLILSASQLILTDAVLEPEMEIDVETGTESNHKHKIKGKHKIKLNNTLKAGDKVVLLRCDGGQQYIVLGRI